MEAIKRVTFWTWTTFWWLSTWITAKITISCIEEGEIDQDHYPDRDHHHHDNQQHVGWNYVGVATVWRMDGWRDDLRLLVPTAACASLITSNYLAFGTLLVFPWYSLGTRLVLTWYSPGTRVFLS